MLKKRVLILVLVLILSISFSYAVINPEKGIIKNKEDDLLFYIEGNSYRYNGDEQGEFMICSFNAVYETRTIDDIRCIRTNKAEGEIPYSLEGRFVYGGINIKEEPTAEKIKKMLGWGELINEEIKQELKEEELKEEEFKEPTGFIIEFKEKPVLKKTAELITVAEANEVYLDNAAWYNPVKYAGPLFMTTNDDIQVEITEQRARVEQEHEFAIAEINNIIPVQARARHSEVQPKIVSRLDYDKNTERYSASQIIVREGFFKPVSKEYFDVFNGIYLDITEEEAMIIQNLENVKSVYPNKRVEAVLNESPALINAGYAWDLGYTGEGISIAVIDTGIDYTHNDLGGCLGEGCKVAGGYDVYNNDTDPMDDHGHGTHCAATAAGNGLLKGIAPDATLYGYKVLDSYGSGSFADVLAGIELAADPNQDGDFSDKADVISMSLGGGGNPDDPISTAVDNAVDAGVIAVISAGNSGSSRETIGSPGTARKAITVGASCKPEDIGVHFHCDEEIARFSSRGPVKWDGNSLIKPDIVAPGVDICAAQHDDAWQENECIDDEHTAISGTSMSAPHVAGAAALIKEKHPDWTSEEIKTVIKSTANDLGFDIFSQGAGLIDLEKALNAGKPLTVNIFNSGKYSNREVLEIAGNAFGEDFKDYTVYYQIDGFNDWNELCSSVNPVENNVLCTWDVAEEGDYILKITARKQNNEETEDYAYVSIVNTEITKPFSINDLGSWDIEKVVFNSDKRIEIKGSASGKNFEKYEIYLCPEKTLFSILPDDYEKYCYTNGITVAGNGLSAVENGELGYLDFPSNLDSGFYNIVLVNYYNGIWSDKKSLIYVDKSFQKGWPIDAEMIGSGSFMLASLDQPTIADINNDNKNDLITAYGDIVNVVGYDAKSLEGWPVEINTYYNPTQKAIMQNGPAVGDLDNDGFNEIAIGDNAGYLHIFNHDGTYLFEPEDRGRYVDTVSLADLDNDGFLNIVYSDWSANVHVLDNNGNYLNGWPRHLAPIPGLEYDFLGIYSGTAIGNIDNDKDGYLEIVAAGEMNTNSNYGQNTSSRIFVFNYDGTVMDGWPKDLVNKGGVSVIALADIDYDGMLEIIIGLGKGFVYAYNHDGSLLWEFEIEEKGPWGAYLQGPSVGDINNDNRLEIAFTAKLPYYDEFYNSTHEIGCLFACDDKGNIMDNYPLCKKDDIMLGLSEIPLMADVDADDETEILVPNSEGRTSPLIGFYAFNPDTSVVEGFPKYIDSMVFGNVIPAGDLDNDFDNEIIVKSWKGSVFVYDLEGEGTEWGEYLYDETHKGRYKKTIKVNCLDSDNGKDFFTKGFTINKISPGGYWDECTSWFNEEDKAVKEYYCRENNDIYIHVEECEFGCLDGACISNKCVDSDGINYYEKGTARKGNETKEDSCILMANLQYRLKEYYCDGEDIASEDKICDKCIDGKCIFEFEEFPSPFIYFDNGEHTADFKIVVGDKAPAEDVVTSVDIANALSTYEINGKTYKVDIDKAVLASDIYDLNQNLILIGNPNDNKITQEFVNEFDYDEGEAMLKIFRNGAYHVIVVAGTTPEATRRAGYVLANYDEFDLKGTDICVQGTSFQDISVKLGDC